jgi:murein DD-endopeptidase MepM/ murein hydrolase activator NlpD
LFLLASCDDGVLPGSINVITNESNYLTHDIYIPRGGNIFSELSKLGLTSTQIIEVTDAFGDKVGFRSVQPNDHFQLVMDTESKRVIEFSYLPDIITTHKVVRNLETNLFDYRLVERPIETRMLIISGIVYTTLDQALIASNVDSVIRHTVTNALSSRINFSAHTRSGDSFKIMYEQRYLDGEPVSGARLYYMSYTGRITGFHEGFRYMDTDERSAFNGFYTPTGIAMSVGQYRWPLDRIHVTSPFGNRIHPITRRWQMHTGVDYRGSIGTPVYAVASGTVIKAGRDGGWGNVIEIQHENNYVTQYAHLNRINVRVGNRVNRGAVIGTVGSTGFSTGPHLHFGLRVGGRWINPANLRMVAATRLEGRRLEEHRTQMAEIKNILYRIENESLSPFELIPIEKYRRQNVRIS